MCTISQDIPNSTSYWTVGKGNPAFTDKNENKYTSYTRDATFFYIADQKQAPCHVREWIVVGLRCFFLLLQTLKRGVARQDFAEKHSVPTFMFRHK